MEPKRIIRISILLFIGLVLLEIFFAHPHSHYWWHQFPGFDALYGFLGCILIIVASKALGEKYLEKNEDYWEEKDND
jgi:hypothetical protein